MLAATVARSSRRAPAKARKASGSSAKTADSRPPRPAAPAAAPGAVPGRSGTGRHGTARPGPGLAGSPQARRALRPVRGVRPDSYGAIQPSLSPAHCPPVDCGLAARGACARWVETRLVLGTAGRKLGKVSELAYFEFGATPVEYREAWDLQRRVHARRVADEVPDSCLLLEHEPVYTAGKRTAVSDRPFGNPGAPVIDVDRGGKITWHGPGQLTGYPIIKLREPLDVVAYVRALEEAMIRTCAEFGVGTGRVPGRSGTWVPGDETRPDRKVGAIGARVARGVTMHGFALNADCDLSWYDRIVPCGISDAGTTTLSAETGRAITVAEVAPVMKRHLADVLR